MPYVPMKFPIQIQSIEMTKQFSTNMYFALIGGLIISFHSPFIKFGHL